MQEENIQDMIYKSYNRNNLDLISELSNLPEELINEIKIVSLVVPFRTNNYVIKELIDWDNVPQDPIFKLNFPQKKMLNENYFNKLQIAIKNDFNTEEMNNLRDEIFSHLNPHPGGQICFNTPRKNGEILKGIQHKYRETVLCFPSEGQMCHAFCTYCFRWAQFINKKNLKMSLNDPQILVEYLQENEEIQEILFTGGDPMIMKANKLAKYIEPLLEADIKHLKTIRIGTKSLTYWPYRYVSDSDTGRVLEIFNKIVDSGVHLSLVANFNHPNELKTSAVKEAIKTIKSTGAVIRTQSPLLNNINNETDTWIQLLRKQVDLGLIPYYMFVVRDTGAKNYFEVPLVDAVRIYTNATRKLSGLCKTIRGPVMSTTAGKIHVIGITSLLNKRVIAMKFIQARNPKWIGRIFFAKFDKNAAWIDELEPAFSKKFFYELDMIKYLTAYSNQQTDSIEEEILKPTEIIGET